MLAASLNQSKTESCLIPFLDSDLFGIKIGFAKLGLDCLDFSNKIFVSHLIDISG